jgi:hypothetical protein
MTATAEEVVSEAGFEWAELNEPDAVEATPGPLSGSRGTRRTTGTRRRSASSKKLEILQKKLSSEMFQAGTMIGMGLHTTGYYICQESDTFTKAVIQLAAKRPEWVEALEHLADIQPGIVVGRTMIGIGAAFAVDRGRANPEKQFMRFLGVYSAWQAVNSDGERVEGSAYQPPPAGAFVPVG